ncbi:MULTISPECIES: carboxymuconolactone decarboxylase family protein [unclassified Variovorax]|uniref:carboxymuconolactone decarboxylase family protein n=1 Tax=unclassified Variovorax TaxID=663243 RepID=UPI001F0C0288|nr:MULTISPECIES: carboxymuconolactone decarboxylase family protein [unclassified Variovorax]
MRRRGGRWPHALAHAASPGARAACLAKSPYFRLLARDPDTLGARTRTDKDIFYNPEAGLPRAERELSAATASRYNGCIYCVLVHARFASHFSQRTDDVQRLLKSADAVAGRAAGAGEGLTCFTTAGSAASPGNGRWQPVRPRGREVRRANQASRDGSAEASEGRNPAPARHDRRDRRMRPGKPRQ